MSDLTKSTYADAARAYLRSKRVVRYHLKKVDEMSDDEVVRKCHFYQEENDLVQDYWAFVKENFPHLA